MKNTRRGPDEQSTGYEHIGKGKIGLAAFRFIMRDHRFRKIPKVLETPKAKDLREDLMNLKALRALADEQ